MRARSLPFTLKKVELMLKPSTASGNARHRARKSSAVTRPRSPFRLPGLDHRLLGDLAEAAFQEGAERARVQGVDAGQHAGIVLVVGGEVEGLRLASISISRSSNGTSSSTMDSSSRRRRVKNLPFTLKEGRP
jgi:hypothetical protein